MSNKKKKDFSLFIELHVNGMQLAKRVIRGNLKSTCTDASWATHFTTSFALSHATEQRSFINHTLDDNF
jgi:hypothetical protein